MDNSVCILMLCIPNGMNMLCALWHITQMPPLPLALPLLAGSTGGTNKESLMRAEKLLHSYPSSVWSWAAVTHAVSQLETKAGLQAVLALYSKFIVQPLKCTLYIMSFFHSS